MLRPEPLTPSELTKPKIGSTKPNDPLLKIHINNFNKFYSILKNYNKYISPY